MGTRLGILWLVLVFSAPVAANEAEGPVSAPDEPDTAGTQAAAGNASSSATVVNDTAAANATEAPASDDPSGPATPVDSNAAEATSRAAPADDPGEAGDAPEPANVPDPAPVVGVLLVCPLAEDRSVDLDACTPLENGASVPSGGGFVLVDSSLVESYAPEATEPRPQRVRPAADGPMATAPWTGIVHQGWPALLALGLMVGFLMGVERWRSARSASMAPTPLGRPAPRPAAGGATPRRATVLPDGRSAFHAATRHLRRGNESDGLRLLDRAFRLAPELVVRFLGDPRYEALRRIESVQRLLRRMHAERARVWIAYA